MIRIKSKYHNFRRCGIAHPKEATEYPDDRFSAKELKTLKAEPMLTVEDIDDPDTNPENMTIAQLKKELEGAEIPVGAKKAQLILLLKATREQLELASNDKKQEE